jgi:hypothetical protein
MPLCIHRASRALITNHPAVVGLPPSIVASFTTPPTYIMRDMPVAGSAAGGWGRAHDHTTHIWRTGTMGKDASAALGGAEVAGTVVSPRVLTRKTTRRSAGGHVGGMAGELAASAAGGKTSTGAPDMPRFGRVGYLAASETEVALTKTSQLGFTPHPTGGALVRVPRSEVASVALAQGRLLSQLRLSFANGVTWEFEIARLHRKGAQQFVSALGGTVS